MYLNLLFKSLKADKDNAERVKAIVRRFVQMLVSGGNCATEFDAGGLYLLGELFSSIPGLRSMLTGMATQEGDSYAPRKRDPQYVNVSASPLWKLVRLCFVPRSSTTTTPPSPCTRASSSPANHSPVTASVDLSLSTISHFLDRFVYKNPKKIKANRSTNVVMGKGLSAMQPRARKRDTMPVILGTSPLHWGLASDCIPDRKPGVDNVLHLQYPLRQPTPAFPATVHPNPPATPPPGSRYPQGPTLSLKTDYNYYLNQCYTIPHREQTDAEQDVFVDELTAIITPPGTVPRVYDVQSRSWVVEDIAGMTAMPFGIPVAVDITPLSDNETTARLTAAACFDDACMQSLPDYPEIKAHLDELGNLAFGLDGGTPLYAFPGLKRNMRLPAPSPDHPYDSSSGHASTVTEGNGQGWITPSVQVNTPAAAARRLRVLEIGAMLWILLTRYALSMEERLASMFRAFDLNIFSIGGLLPTGLTGMQQNISSAWNGGDLAGFIGSVQGSWHVDIHDDANRWTMLIVLMKLPPVDDDSGASSEQDDTDLEGDDDEDMEAEDDVSFIVSTSVDIKSGDRFYTVRWSGYGEAADTKEPAASLQNSPLLLSSFEERQNNPSSYESLMTFAGKGAIHLANAFSRDPRLSTELSTLHKLRNDLISKAVSPASLHIPELLGDMELVEDIIHDFRAGFGQHELGRAVETVVQTSVLLGGVERAATESRAVTYVVNHLRAKAYMVFYDWHTNSGRTLARELVLAHRDQQLQERFPRYAPAVTLVLDRLNAYAAVTMARVRAQPTTIAINVDVLRALWTSCPNGLDFKFAAKGRAALANERSKESWMVDTIYDFLTFNIVEPQISAACPTANSVYDLIFRGAVCTAIVDALDDDGIMSYPHLHEYLTTAKSLFGKGHTNRIAQDEKVQEEARQLATLAREIAKLAFNIRLPQCRRGPARSARNSTALVPIGGIGRAVSPSTPLANLCPHELQPCWGFLALMFRETLAFVHDPEYPYIESLRRILACQHLQTTQFTSSLNPDHYNIIRRDSHVQRIISDSLSCMELTSRYGLSNILLRLRTGQSYRTRAFCEGHLSVCVTTPQQAASIFRAGYRKRLLVADTRCWGQPSKSFAVDASNTTNMVESFTPLFEQGVLDAWDEYCKRLATQLPTYTDALALIDSLNIWGLGRGSITRMQLANFLALSDLCEPPSVQEISAVIWENKKGATQGLKLLGFEVSGKQAKDRILAAVQIVQGFLDDKLGVDDKKTLGFGTIFIEHFLCKVTRWHRMLLRHNLIEEIAKLLANPDKLQNLPFSLRIERADLEKYLGQK
ncbi:CBF domain-containing protein [Mycena kentingensis (nom. inval.)]|nr:CBF domain-containing protein [Mycena kentingensis (nom. inval.)]